MIELDRVTITVNDRAQARTVLSPTNLTIPSDRRIVLLGPSPEDKTALINLLGGITLPRAGRIIRKAKVSFPVGHLGGFVPSLPVRINVAHLAELYDADVKTVVDFVESTVNLGSAFDRAYGQLSNVAKRDLGRIVTLSIPFDLYLLPEDFMRGKKPLADTAYDLFQARRRTAGMIIPMRHPELAYDYCEAGLVLIREQLRLYENVEDAIAAAQG